MVVLIVSQQRQQNELEILGKFPCHASRAWQAAKDNEDKAVREFMVAASKLPVRLRLPYLPFCDQRCCSRWRAAARLLLVFLGAASSPALEAS